MIISALLSVDLCPMPLPSVIPNYLQIPSHPHLPNETYFLLSLLCRLLPLSAVSSHTHSLPHTHSSVYILCIHHLILGPTLPQPSTLSSGQGSFTPNSLPGCHSPHLTGSHAPRLPLTNHWSHNAVTACSLVGLSLAPPLPCAPPPPHPSVSKRGMTTWSFLYTLCSQMLDAWADGWMEGWVHGWMEGWVHDG